METESGGTRGNNNSCPITSAYLRASLATFGGMLAEVIGHESLLPLVVESDGKVIYWFTKSAGDGNGKRSFATRSFPGRPSPCAFGAGKQSSAPEHRSPDSSHITINDNLLRETHRLKLSILTTTSTLANLNPRAFSPSPRCSSPIPVAKVILSGPIPVIAAEICAARRAFGGHLVDWRSALRADDVPVELL
jgi:hypothetical protein